MSRPTITWTEVVIARACKLRDQGRTFQSIADELGPPFTKSALISKLRSRRERPAATKSRPTGNRLSGGPRSRTPAYPGSKIDPDTGRDPAVYPVGSDVWATRDGQITIIGVIWGRGKSWLLPKPFVFFQLDHGPNGAYSPTAWRNLMVGARLVKSAEDRLREAGETPKWAGPPNSTKVA